MNYKITLRIAIVSILFLLSFSKVSAQIVQKIGSNSFTINPKAVLELESTTKGFLPPRMTTAQQTSISLGSNEKGLIVYVTDAPVPGLKIWDGTKWVSFADTAALAAEVTRATGVEGTLTTNVTANTSSISTLQSEQMTQNSAIALNTAKIGITTEQAKAITANTAKVGITDGQAIEIAANTLKVGITKAHTDAIDANTLKVGITTEQATAITANVAAILLKEDVANKSKDIYTDQASDVKFPSVKAVKTYVDVYSTFNAISTITSSYTATISDYTILCNNNSGNFQLTLPTASTTSGKIYVIRKTDESTNILTISPALKLTESTAISSLDYPKTMRVQSNGTAWYIID